MTFDNQIKDEKLQSYIDREAAKISALSSGKIDKYEISNCRQNITDVFLVTRIFSNQFY